jgi:ABC-type transporter Mla MlaB component
MIATTRSQPGELRIAVAERLDLEEVRRFRRAVSVAERPDRLEIDMQGVRAADGGAVLLLESDLTRLQRAGTRVSMFRVPRRLQVQLHLHPILRFADDVDDLFTDPDLEWPGFRPSGH